MSELKRSYGLATIVNHYDEHNHPLHAHVMPVYQTSSFGFDNMAEAEETFSGRNKENFVYTRGRNPNAISLAKNQMQRFETERQQFRKKRSER